MGKIHLIRHGITEAIKSRVYYGHTDVPLSSEGIDRIVDLVRAGIYPDADGARLYTSGLLRAEQTFFLIYGCREHQTDPRLREYNFGEFEMKTHEQLMENKAYQVWIRDKDGVIPCPGGESRRDFETRVAAGFSDLLNRHKDDENPEESSIVICHGGVISQIMNTCFPNCKENVYQWGPEPGRGYTIHIEGTRPVAFDEI